MARAPGAATAQVALEVGGDGVAVGLGCALALLGLLLELPDVLAHLVVGLGHLGDRALPLLGLLGKGAEGHLDVECGTDAQNENAGIPASTHAFWNTPTMPVGPWYVDGSTSIESAEALS